MPEIPDGARRPEDHQSAAVKPQEHVDGWTLLRPPIDLEFWEVTDFLASVSKLKQRGSEVELTTANLKALGELTKQMQEVFALDSTAFKAWLKQSDGILGRAKKVIELANEYADSLGEAVGSAS